MNPIIKAVTRQVHLVQNRYAKSFLKFIFLKFDILLFGMKSMNRLNVEKKIRSDNFCPHRFRPTI